MISELQVFLENEEATLDFGRNLAVATFLKEFTSKEPVVLAENEGTETLGAVFYLLGDLGAGKTTLARGVMRGYGYQGAVKSPTYTIVEPYEFRRFSIYHFDLYRLYDSEEINYLGVEDYFASQNICLIEWADRCKKSIPQADIVLSLADQETGRLLSCQSLTEKGFNIAERLRKQGRNQ